MYSSLAARVCLIYLIILDWSIVHTLSWIRLYNHMYFSQATRVCLIYLIILDWSIMHTLSWIRLYNPMYFSQATRVCLIYLIILDWCMVHTLRHVRCSPAVGNERYYRIFSVIDKISHVVHTEKKMLYSSRPIVVSFYIFTLIFWKYYWTMWCLFNFIRPFCPW